MHPLRIGAAIACASLLPRDPGAGGTELLVNGGFEEMLTGWQHLDMTGTLVLELDAKTRKEGKQALRVTRGEGEKVDFVKQFARLSADDGEVEFSIQYRVEREGKARIQIFFFDDAGTELGGFVEVAQSGDTKKKWVRAEKKAGVPPGATSFGLNVWAIEPGTFWIDGVTAVHDAPESAAVEERSLALANGGFDEDLDGWELAPFGSGTARASRDNERRAAGEGALRLERTSARLDPEDGWRAFVPKSSRQKVKRVELAFACALEVGARPAVHLQALSESGAVLASARCDPAAADSTFVRGTLSLELPPATRGLAVTLAIGGRGKTWFDDLRLEVR